MSEELIALREALEDAYNKLKIAMAHARNEEVYATLEEARRALITTIQAVNDAIDIDAPYEVIEE
jgi:hypothetical protein